MRSILFSPRPKTAARANSDKAPPVFEGRASSAVSSLADHSPTSARRRFNHYFKSRQSTGLNFSFSYLTQSHRKNIT